MGNNTTNISIGKCDHVYIHREEEKVIGESITPENWQKIREMITTNTALQITGDLQSGKTSVIKNLIHNNKENRYIVLDVLDEYSELPAINQISQDLKESCRIVLPKQPCGAQGIFEMYKDMLMYEKMPENYILVVEHAERYVDSGLEILMAESPSFIKVIAVSCRQLFDFCPTVKVERGEGI